ncbi:MAG: Ig-like domain-containing protein [Geminicoccaceae bacterium]
MAKDPANSDGADMAIDGEEIVVAQDGGAPPGGSAATSPGADSSGTLPAAVDDCTVTDQATVLNLPVLDNDLQAAGQNLEIIALTQPESGRAEIADDGSIRFTPDQPGLQEVRYVVDDGNGGTADAKLRIFVNADDGQIDQPVLAGFDPSALSEVARSCVDGMALDLVNLAGNQVIIDPPAPGQRIQVAAAPGQRIEIRDETFLEPELLKVDGGLLIVAEDGRMIFLEGFAAAAEDADPVLLSIADQGPFTGDTIMLASLDTEVGRGLPRGDLQLADGSSDAPNPFPEPAAGPTGPAHGGGAGFSPYDPGGIGNGPDPIGPQPPTALGLGSTETVLADPGGSGLTSLANGGNDPGFPGDPNDPGNPGDPGNPNRPGDPDGPGGPDAPLNQAPTISINTNISVEIGELTVGGPTFVSGPPLPDLDEGRTVSDASINGVDGDNLVIGGGGDAAIIFRDELALFQNSIGVYLIGENGEMLDPRLAFTAIEHADEFFDENGNQQHAFIRPGGGPLSPGDQVLMSELYPDQDLPPGTSFGLFLVVDGGNVEDLVSAENLAFQNTDGDPATIFDTSPPTFLADGEEVCTDVFHALGSRATDSTTNLLNPDEGTQAISGFVADGTGLTIAFEDVHLRHGDDDFNDTVVDVLPIPEPISSLPFVNVEIAVDATVVDVDDANLSAAVVEISSGAAAGDRLSLSTALDGTGITVVEDGSGGRLVLEGSAPIETYQTIIRGLTFQFGDGDGEREVSFQVTDDAGNGSNIEVVSINPSTLTAEVGTEGDDTLVGENGVDNAIAGRGGDDNLFGDTGDDVLDGGLGDDFLFGDAGDDLLVGGPGADVINGGDGADQHRYFSIAERGDRIEGFNAEEGDVLNLSDVLGDDANTGNIEDFVRFEQVGSDVEVSIDVDGGGGAFAFLPYVTLVDPVGVTTVEEAANNGTVIA